MPRTPKKALTSSSTARIENVANAVLAGRPAQLSQRPALQLAEAVLYLLKENRRLTTSSALRKALVSQLKRSLQETDKLRQQALQQLLAYQLQTLDRSQPEASVRHNPLGNSHMLRAERERSAEATRALCNLPTHKFPRLYR